LRSFHQYVRLYSTHSNINFIRYYIKRADHLYCRLMNYTQEFVDIGLHCSQLFVENKSTLFVLIVLPDNIHTDMTIHEYNGWIDIQKTIFNVKRTLNQNVTIMWTRGYCSTKPILVSHKCLSNVEQALTEDLHLVNGLLTTNYHYITVKPSPLSSGQSTNLSLSPFLTLIVTAPPFNLQSQLNSLGSL